MATVVILGTQWGDEGKGKITNFISKKANVVVRYQGGNNAGHSIVIKGVKYALNLLPSGIFSKNVKNVLANGVVIDLFALEEEIKKIKKQNINDFKLFISDRAHVVMPYHIEMDKLQEELKKERNIGTTKKGIGPAYSDKHGRDGIRVIDLFDDSLLQKLIEENAKIKNAIFKHFGRELIDEVALFKKLKKIRKFIEPFVIDTSALIQSEIQKGKNILFEGAQGVLLCIDHGTYPFVTSSSPTSSSVATNVGIGPNMIDKVVGVVKAYSTRVGTGGFPTEILDNDGLRNYIRETGKEYGTVTGRPRRIGWFDAALVKYAVRLNNISDLAITLLDVLTSINKIKICTHYTLRGKKVEHIPSLEKDFNQLKPVYIEVDGWTEDITRVKSFEELPTNAKKYLQTLEELLGTKVSIFSVGPDKEQTIEINQIFE